MLVASVCIVMLTTFMFGWTNGNINSPALVIRAALGLAHDPASDAAWGWCVSIYCVGGMLGCASSARAADYLGRKRFVLITAVLFMCGAGLQVAAVLGGSKGLACMLAGRLVVGIASGGTTVVVPAYLSEIAPEDLRATLGVAFQLMVTVSMLLAQLSGMAACWGTERLWPLVLGFVALPCALQLLLMPWLSESPRWLAQVGLVEEAARAQSLLARGSSSSYTGLSDVTVPSEASAEFAGVGERELASPVAGSEQPAAPSASERERDGGAVVGSGSERGSLLALLADARLRGLLAVAVVSLVTQQLSGINVAFNFSAAYLQANGASAQLIDTVTVGMNLANVGATLLAAWLVERSGRRSLLLGSALGMAACTAVITLGMAHIHTATGMGVATGGIVAFVAAFGIGLGPIPWILPSELFEQRHRATAQGFAAMCNWMANGVVALTFLPIAQVLREKAFVPFGCLLVVYSAYAYVALPETRDT